VYFTLFTGSQAVAEHLEVDLEGKVRAPEDELCICALLNLAIAR